jgi:hypothetical protein
MALTGSYIPDGPKIHQLITCPGGIRQPKGAVTRFAKRIGRHRQTIWNLKAGYPASQTLLQAIADGLGVDISEITLPAQPAPRETAGHQP